LSSAKTAHRATAATATERTGVFASQSRVVAKPDAKPTSLLIFPPPVYLHIEKTGPFCTLIGREKLKKLDYLLRSVIGSG